MAPARGGNGRGVVGKKASKGKASLILLMENFVTAGENSQKKGRDRRAGETYGDKKLFRKENMDDRTLYREASGGLSGSISVKKGCRTGLNGTW